MAWNSDRFDQQISHYDDDNWGDKGFSAKAAKLFEEDEKSTTQSAISPTTDDSILSDNWETKGFSAKAAKLFEEIELSTSNPTEQAQASTSILSDDWETKGFSAKAAKLFEEYEISTSDSTQSLQSDSSILSDDWETKGFSAKAAQIFQDDVSGTIPEGKQADTGAKNTKKKRTPNTVRRVVHEKSTNASFHDEEKTSFTGKAVTANYHDEDKASFAGKSTSASFHAEDKASFAGKATSASFHAEDKTSFAGKATSASFHAEDKASFAGKATSASFHAEDKASFAGKTTSASFYEKSRANADWDTTSIQTGPKTNAHDHTSKSNAPVKTNAHDHTSKSNAPVKTNAHDHTSKSNAPVKTNAHDHEMGSSHREEAQTLRDLPVVPKPPSVQRQNTANADDTDELMEIWLNGEHQAVEPPIQDVELATPSQSPKRYYRTYIDSEIESQLRNRGIALLILWPGLIIGCLALLLSGHIFLLILAGIIGGFIIFILNAGRTEIVKKNIVHDELCRYFDEVQYKSDIGINSASEQIKCSLNKSCVGNNRWNSGTISDQFSGTYKGHAFNYFDVALDSVTGSGKSQQTKRIFTGQIIELTLNHQIEKSLTIKSRHTPLQPEEKQVLLSLGFTNREYDLMNEIQFMFLTRQNEETSKPMMTMKQLNLPRLFAAYKDLVQRCNGIIQIRILEDKLYISIERNYNPFEFQSFDSFRSAADIRTRISKEVQENQYILDALLGN